MAIVKGGGCKKANCKWCARGECWSNGQIEKPGNGKAGGKVPKQTAGVKKAIIKKSPATTAWAKPQQQQQQQFLQLAQQFMGKQGMKQIQQIMAASQQEETTRNTGDQSKMLLSQFVSQKTGEQATKDTIMYTTEQVEGVNPPQFVTEVMLVTIDPSKSYKGQPQASKKAAEASAAAKALKANGQGKKGGGKGQQPKAKASKAKASKQKGCKPNCKWCAQGECWTSGQVEKPDAL